MTKSEFVLGVAIRECTRTLKNELHRSTEDMTQRNTKLSLKKINFRVYNVRGKVGICVSTHSQSGCGERLDRNFVLYADIIT
jgi:hypothetical protein